MVNRKRTSPGHKARNTAEGRRDGDALEDVDAFFDQSIIKEQLELLAVRMTEIVRATSEE
jgi:hypothetical protein